MTQERTADRPRVDAYEKVLGRALYAADQTDPASANTHRRFALTAMPQRQGMKDGERAKHALSRAQSRDRKRGILSYSL